MVPDDIGELMRRVDEEVELRFLEKPHAAELFALTDRNRAHLKQWMGWLEGTRTADDTLAFIREALCQRAANNGFQMGIWCCSRLVGTVGFAHIEWPSRSTEIGSWLAGEAQGRGIMTRVVRGLVDHAFADLGLHRVEIQAATGNRRSRAVPERLGFRHEGRRRQAEWLYDRFVDLEVYGLLAPEWAARR